MTTLYKPVPIASAEQAEALPDDAIVVNSSGDRYNRAPSGHWHSAADDRGLDEDLDSHIFPVAITALVPIEAEEEYSTERAGLAWDNDAIYSSPDDVRRDGWTDPLQTRYVTPWESA